MKRLFLMFVVVLTLLFFATAHAHPGSLDENGGHYDYSTGEYHFHHGYPAHSHSGGRCPYNFRDNTNDSYTPSNDYDVTSQYTTAPRPITTQIHLNFFQRHPVLTGFGAFAIIIAIWIAVSSKREKERERARQIQYEKEKQEAVAFYASHDLRTLSKMPDIYYVDEKLVPYEYNKPHDFKYGITLDIYITHGSSKVYHRKGCQHVRYVTPHNVFSDDYLWHFQSRTPCSICKPDDLPEITWYKEYCNHISTCQKYGIQPKQNPIGYSPPAPKESAPPKPAPQVIEPSSSSTPPPRPTVTVREYSPLQSPLHSATTQAPPVAVAEKTSTTILDVEPTENDIPNVPVLYRSKYPTTWFYIQKNSHDPHNYIYYYHYVWGGLQEAHGDGILHGTLTEDQQRLINYPSVGRTIYLSSEKSNSYHSIHNCYSLLKSAPIEVDFDHSIGRKRCTKCVPPS